MAKAKYKSSENIYNTIILPRLAEIKVWTMLGDSMTRIAEKLEISPVMLWRMSQKPSQFRLLIQALSYGNYANKEVESALYNKAIGFTKMIKKPYKLRKESFDKKGRKTVKEEMIEVDEALYFPPDFQAMKYWLNNRVPERWKDEQVDGQTINELLSKGDDVMVKIRELAGMPKPENIKSMTDGVPYEKDDDNVDFENATIVEETEEEVENEDNGFENNGWFPNE